MATNEKNFRIKKGIVVGDGITVEGGAVDLTSATSISGIDASNLTGLGTAATTAATDYATAAQGTLAASATQPGDNVSTLTNDAAFIDLADISVTTGSASGGGSLSYDNTTGVLTFVPVDSASVYTDAAADARIAAASIGDVADVIVTAAATGEFLRYNGSNWVDEVIQATDISQSMVTQHQAALSITESQISDLGTYQVASEKGQANGYASLDGAGLVPAAQLPSYVDDVVEAANFAALPGTGETGKIYVDLATGDVYRWSGSTYVQIANDVSTADSAVQLTTGRDFSATGDVTAAAVSFNGTANVALAMVITEAGVTQHEAALTIAESQVTDLVTHLAAKLEDITAESVGDLSDVDITTAAPTEGQALVWDNANSKFVPGDAIRAYTQTLSSTSKTEIANFGAIVAGDCYKVMVKAVQGTNVEMAEFIVTCDGTDIDYVTYGEVRTNTDVAVIDFVSSSGLSVQASGASASSTAYTVKAIAMQ